MAPLDDFRVPVDKLRRTQDASAFHFECTDELVPLTEFVGQDRGLRALQFGLGIDKAGYNIFVTGLSGTGKATAILEYIQRSLKQRKESGEVRRPDDWCYVYNFDEPDRPDAVRLPAGRGRLLRHQLEQLLEAVRGNLARAFSAEEYEHQRRALYEQGQQRVQAAMSNAQEEAARLGFAVRFSPSGVAVMPIVDGKEMTPAAYAGLDTTEQRAISERQQPVSHIVNDTGEQVRAIERDVLVALKALDRQTVEAIIRGPFETITREYADLADVVGFLARLHEYTVANADMLRQMSAPEPPQTTAGPISGSPGTPDPLVAFHCNPFVDNSDAAAPPVVVESNPTWTNLFGRIERRAYLGTYVSDHTMLKPGALHRANGGYLILNMTDVVSRPGSWDGLKRAIRTNELRLEDPMEIGGFVQPQGLRPEPIPLDVKVVITGDPASYFVYSRYDEDFWEIFKVKADFDFQVPRNEENTIAYAGFICACAERERLRHFDRTAVAQLVELGSRLVDDQQKLSARFGRLRDTIVEADYWAAQSNSQLVSAEHVQRAVNERVYRLNLVEERQREMIGRGTLIVDVDGAVIGQVNGLTVLDFGDFRFGRPARITARTYLGQRGVASIDRESQLSGKIHDKGVLILAGFLGWRYAQDKPLSLSATISFEQGYDPVDGDSASLAELCAVLSSLAEAPLRQDLAITGSVNQKGEVQPIGGVNEKIEGFHDLCRAAGFSGAQGVVVPTRNLDNLMLREDVVQTVRDGVFYIYAVNSVDQALEALTGLPPGERQTDGSYPAGTVNGRVSDKLQQMGEAMRHYGKRPDSPAAPKEEPGTETPPEDDWPGEAPAE